MKNQIDIAMNKIEEMLRRASEEGGEKVPLDELIETLDRAEIEQRKENARKQEKMASFFGA